MAVCVVASGALTYGYLAVVARALQPGEYGWFGAFWSVALVVGFGAFLPLELENARLVHASGGGRLPAGLARAAAGTAAAALLALAAAWPLLSPALGGRAGLGLALAALCVVSAGQFTLRGLLLGRGLLGRHGTVMLVDAGLRVSLAAAVAALAAPATAGPYGWTLVAAIGLAHLPVLAWALRRPAAGPPAGQVRGAALRSLAVGALCAQVLLNGAPVVVAGLAGPAEQVVAAQFAACATLVRLPLFAAVPLQSALLPSLVDAESEGGHHWGRTLATRVLGGIGGLAVLAGFAGWLLGPAVAGLVFGPRYALPGEDVAVLAVGSVLYLGLLLVGQALVAAARQRASAAAWAAGVGAGAVVVTVVPGLADRAALGFAVGAAVGLGTGLVLLARRRADRAPTRAGEEVAG